MTISQEIHNFFYGENFRENNKHFYMRDTPAVKRYRIVPQFVAPSHSMVWGIDISPWDGNVELAVTKGMGADFVFIKGMDGSVRSRYFPENRARAVAAGLLNAPYAWLYRDENVRASAQAAALDALLEQYPSDLPAMLDFEWTKYAGVYRNPTYADLDKWTAAFIGLGNRKPILYTAPGYLAELGAFPASLLSRFSGFCIANYGVNSPIIPPGIEDWTFWQFTDYADAQFYAPNDANKRELDIDYWKGDRASLYAFAGGVVPPAGGTMGFYKAIGNISIRTGPSTTYARVNVGGQDQYVLINDIIEAGAPSAGFVKIIKLYRNNEVIPLPVEAYCGSQFLTPTTYDPPTVPMLPDLPISFTAGDDVTYEKQTVNIVLKPKQ